VDDALGPGLAQPLLRGLHQCVGVVGARFDRGRRELHPGLELRPDALVALPPTFVLEVALLL
jgi:hypothetical protein